MKRNDFIKELEKRLKYLPKEDREDAIAYYNEYIDDMELAEDEDLSDRIGSPKEVAREIIENCTIKAVEKQKEKGSVKGSGKIVWLVILAVASIPVSVPVAVALTVVVVALLAALLIVLASLFAASLAVICAGIACVAGCFVTPGFSNILVMAGAGTITTGIGIFMMFGIIELFKLFIKLIGKIIVKIKGDKK